MNIKDSHTRSTILHAVFAFCFFILTAQTASAATMYFSPSSGDFTVGNILNASVLVNTGGVSVNNADAVINFPSSLLEIISVTKSSSIFSLWVEEPAFSNSAGTISFNGGIPTPGFNGSAGKLLNVTFRVRNPGLASLVFSSAAVRANDGYGTDILKTKSQAQFNLISEEKPVQTTPALGTPQAPKISSPTHPDSNVWYNNTNPLFTWSVPSGVTSVRLLYDTRAVSSPSVSYGAIDHKQLSAVGDGVYYFHAQFANASGLGASAHMRFQIDTIPPKPFPIYVVHESDSDDPRAIISFETIDTASGIDRYTVSVGDANPVTVQPAEATKGAYVLPVGKDGRQTVVVKAYDRAGNSTTESISLTVVALDPPTITDYSKQVSEGEPFTVFGTTYPNASVVITIKNPSGDTDSASAIADASGEFSFAWTKRLTPGAYSFTAVTKNTMGAISPSTESRTFVVSSTPLAKWGNTIFGYLLFLFVIIAVIAFLIAVAMVLWYRLARLRHWLKQFTTRSERSVQYDFERIMDDLHSLAVLLHKTKQQRQLTEEEDVVLEMLKKHLKKMEDDILARLEQVDREAGG